MDRLDIKWKLALLAIIAGMGFFILITYNYVATSTLMRLNNIHQQTVTLEAEMLMMRRHEKDFIARKNLKYLDKFEQAYTQITLTLDEVKQDLLSADISIKHIKELKIVLSSYEEKFAALVKQQQTIGLHSKDGLYGSLRAEVHQIENLLTERENSSGSSAEVHSLMRTMLMLRRHEKDFMLRRDMEYVDKFNQRTVVMANKLANSEVNYELQQKNNRALENYQQKFLQLVQAEQLFGLTSNQGLLGEMRGSIHQSEELLKGFNQFANKQIEQYTETKKWVDIGVGLCLIVVIMLALMVIANGISIRITNLTKLMTLAARSKNLSLRASISGNDEISAMANIYNGMMAEFDGLMTEVKNSSLELAQAANDLNRSNKHTTAGVNRQLNDSEQLVSAMTQVNDSVVEVAFNALEAAKASSVAEQASANGHQLVTENRRSFVKLVADIENSGEIIQALSKESNIIEAMLNDIRSIADQTNLLALNAAIEAARAGEQGRGFAVVADEVRTLAQRSSESALEIENVVTRLQSLAAEAVTAMRLGQNQAEDSVENTNNVELALGDIKNSSETVNSMNRQIATAAEQQSTVVQEINRNLISIAEVAKNTADLSLTISASSEQLQHLSDQLGLRVLKFTLSC